MHQWILAIEPDRRQSAKLATLGRNQRAEMIVVGSVQEALDTLDKHLPDLLLISPLLLPKDEARLASRLRQLATDGVKLPTLLIPILETPNRKPSGPQKSVVTPFRPVVKSPRAQEMCDPVVFRAQLSNHLERLAAERPAQAPVPMKRRTVTVLRETRAEAIEYTPIADATQAEPRSAPIAASRSSGRSPEWRDLLSALQRDLERMKTENLEPQKPAVASPRPAGRRTVPAPVPIQTPRPAPPTQPATSSPAPTQAAPATDPARKKKAKHEAPAKDEWGIFDPEQCGFAALRARLSEIADTDKKPD